MSSDVRQFRWGRLQYAALPRWLREAPTIESARWRWALARASGPEPSSTRRAIPMDGTVGSGAGAVPSPGRAVVLRPAAYRQPPVDESLQARASDAPAVERAYELRVKIDGRWERVGIIYAASHDVAVREASGRLTPSHAELPIRLEELHGDADAQEAPHGCGRPAL